MRYVLMLTFDYDDIEAVRWSRSMSTSSQKHKTSVRHYHKLAADGNPYACMDTSTSYVYMVWRLHRLGFGVTSALDGSLIFDRSISFLEKLLLTLLRIYTRLDCLESRGLKCCCEYQPPHWFILIAIFHFPSLL